MTPSAQNATVGGRLLAPPGHRLAKPRSRADNAGRALKPGAPGTKIVLDLITLAAAATVSIAASESSTLPSGGTPWTLSFVGATAVALFAAGVYRPQLAPRLFGDIGGILAATASAVLVVTFARVFLEGEPTAAEAAIRDWGIVTAYLVAARIGLQLARRRTLHLHADAGDRALVVGAGPVGRLVAERLMASPRHGPQPAAYLDSKPVSNGHPLDLPLVDIGPAGPDGAWNGSLESALAGCVRERGIGHVIVTFANLPYEASLEIMRVSAKMGLSVWLVPRLFEGASDRSHIDHLGGIPLVAIRPTNPRGLAIKLKYGLDRVAAAGAILLASPVLVAASLAILVAMGKPVLIRQRRVGLDGKPFDMLKFRTMTGEADPPSDVEELARSGIAPGLNGSSARLTPLGKILRRASVDELPQLFNVLRGEMSMVGPRPERLAFARAFDASIRRYADRQRVKSGITGWAQVHGLRGSTSLADRVEWDNYYIENWSLWLDLKVLALTLPALLRDRVE